VKKPTKSTPKKTPKPTAKESIDRYDLLDETIRRFSGQLDELESALGMYMIGHHFGWKVLHMLHSKKTIRKYEEILGLKVTEAFEPVGPDADRTNAHKIIQTVSNFWKAVSGDEKVDMDRETRRAVN
jgi:hypothetical protein